MNPVQSTTPLACFRYGLIWLIQFKRETEQTSADVTVIFQARLTLSLF